MKATIVLIFCLFCCWTECAEHFFTSTPLTVRNCPALIAEAAGAKDVSSRLSYYDVTPPKAVYSENGAVGAIALPQWKNTKTKHFVVYFWEYKSNKVFTLKLKSGQVVRSLSIDRTGARLGIAYDTGDVEIVTLGFNRWIHRWSTTKLIGKITEGQTDLHHFGSQFSSCGKYFMSSLLNKTQIWRIDDPSQSSYIQHEPFRPPRFVPTQDSATLELLVVANDKILLQKASDSTLQLITTREFPVEKPNLAKISDDGKILVTASGNRKPTITTWSTETGQQLDSTTLDETSANSYETEVLGFSPDGNYVFIWRSSISNSDANALYIIEIANEGKRIMDRHTFVFSSEDGKPTFALAPKVSDNEGGQALFALQFDYGIRVFNAKTGVLVQLIKSIRNGTTRDPYIFPPLFRGISFSHSGQIRTTLIPDGNLHYYQIQTEFPVFQVWSIESGYVRRSGEPEKRAFTTSDENWK